MPWHSHVRDLLLHGEKEQIKEKERERDEGWRTRLTIFVAVSTV